MKKCKVCGKPLRLRKDGLYIVGKKDNTLRGPFTTQIQYFEAFDCPRCGCQNIVGVRETWAADTQRRGKLFGTSFDTMIIDDASAREEDNDAD